DAELRIQTIKTTIVEFLRDIFNNHGDIIGNITSDKYLVLMSGSTISSFADKDSFIKKKAEQIMDVIASNGYSAQVGIGYYADTPEKFRGSFRSAWNALNIGKKIQNSNNIYNIKDFTLENLLLSLNKENVASFITPHLEKFRSSKDWNDELETTLREWLDHPYQPSEVAHKLGIHRNSLYYRIDKINEICNFDIKNSQDVFFLKFCILLEDLFKST
ncbi:MAG: helix-turn-helix domain-containing protein, partial [Synergistaceae bacterium]